MAARLTPTARRALALAGVIALIALGFLALAGIAPAMIVGGLMIAAAVVALGAVLSPEEPAVVAIEPRVHAAANALPKPAVTPLATASARAGDEDLRRQIEALRSTQAELLLAKQGSEAAALAKDEFLATMSHEIRTPLNGVLPLLELVLSTKLSPDQHEQLATAYRSAQEMLRIVDDILDYSKLDVGKVELESIGLNLRELVNGVAQLMRRSAEAKGLRLTVNIDPNVRLAVRGDPVRMRQVLMNLVSNAVKFTARGSVTIMVSRRGETATRHEIAFAVRDTGIGIAPDAAARLFQPFAQGDASITRAFGGTGLGLVISKRLVDLMGGQIGVQSEAGKGSMFWFSVPLLKVVGDLPAQSGMQDRRALLIGAEDVGMRRLQGALREIGLQTSNAPTPTDALNTLHANVGKAGRWKYDLVAIDAAEFPTRAQTFLRSVMGDTSLGSLRILLLSEGDDGIDALDPERAAMLPRAFGEQQLRVALDALLAKDPPPSARDAAPVANAAAGALKFAGRVLLVEDNPVNLQVAQRLLSLHGVRADSAGNGEEALQRLAADAYDLVLMDCQMPVMDGHTATRQWRAREAANGGAKHLPIIAMTANAMAGDREKCLASGMDDYLSKPLNRAALQQALARWLAPGDVDATAPVAATPPPAAPGRREPAAEPTPAPTPATPQPKSVLDMEIVREIEQMMGADFGLLVRVYLDETPPKIIELEIAAIHADATTMITQAHSLKSSSANLGALHLAELARAVEEGLRVNPQQSMQAEVARIRSEFARVAAELEPLGDKR